MNPCRGHVLVCSWQLSLLASGSNEAAIQVSIIDKHCTSYEHCRGAIQRLEQDNYIG
jgi:hypothetical protein